MSSLLAQLAERAIPVESETGRRHPLNRAVSTTRHAVEAYVPGLRAVRTYERSWLCADLVAGLVLAAILVPQGMAYAELAGLPAGHRALHDDRLPRRLRDLRAVARARARARTRRCRR